VQTKLGDAPHTDIALHRSKNMPCFVDKSFLFGHLSLNLLKSRRWSPHFTTAVAQKMETKFLCGWRNSARISFMQGWLNPYIVQYVDQLQACTAFKDQILSSQLLLICPFCELCSMAAVHSKFRHWIRQKSKNLQLQSCWAGFFLGI
jgi:hypothetical protein